MKQADWIRDISQHELGLLGVQDLAYVKRVAVEGKIRYAIHAADGTEIAVLDNRDIAFATLRQHDLEPMSVH